MLTLSITLFILAAILGLIVLIAILKNKPTPKPVVFIHGFFAVIALLIVVFFIAQHNGSGPIASLVIFILAAMGGLTLFVKDMQKKPLPKWLAIMHPIIAAAGLITLIIYAVK